jgi:septal ring factor EnvC (AmiA/AmiB activator)
MFTNKIFYSKISRKNRMKKSILALTLCACTTGALLPGCSTSAEKSDNAQKNITEANGDLEKADAEWRADIEDYRRETAEKIAANQKSINEFNARISKEKKEAKADYERKIADLEAKNNDMKKRLDDYKAEGKEKWEKFKTEFNRDMNVLVRAFKDFTISNTK